MRRDRKILSPLDDPLSTVFVKELFWGSLCVLLTDDSL